MDSKLQQAIIATRAGYNETAQTLLTDVLQENPKDTEAWFLLAHLVESTERQARYLEHTLILDPNHELARRHLGRLLNPEVPPPVIKEYSEPNSTPPQATPPPTLSNKFSPIPPAKTNPVLTISSGPNESQKTPTSGNMQVITEQNSSRIDANWQRTAGPPKRETRSTPEVQGKQKIPADPANIGSETTPESKEEPVNKWLLVLFFILIFVAVFVVSFLAFTIIFQ
jgi:hypothetical protein